MTLDGEKVSICSNLNVSFDSDDINYFYNRNISEQNIFQPALLLSMRQLGECSHAGKSGTWASISQIHALVVSPLDVLIGSQSQLLWYPWLQARLQPWLIPAEMCLAVRELLPRQIGLPALRRGASVFPRTALGTLGWSVCLHLKWQAWHGVHYSSESALSCLWRSSSNCPWFPPHSVLEAIWEGHF